MLLRWILMVLSIGLCALPQSAVAEDPIQITSNSSELTMAYRGKPILVYAFGANQFKPYVKALYTLSGDNVLRDAPADHLHHHGLMYAIRINGINFWEEQNQPGYERHIQWLAKKTSERIGGRPAASVTEMIHWVAEKNASQPDTLDAALLIEERTLTLVLSEPDKEVALRWHSQFKVGKTEVKLHGSAYNGLGLRLPATWDLVAKHRNSEDRPYSPEQKSDVIPARWAAVSHSADNREFTVALFGGSGNRGETRFFSMINPFTYLSVTQNLEKGPLQYKPGDQFAIDYLLLAYSEKKSAAFLDQRYASWVK